MNTLRGQYSFIAQFLGGQPVEPEKTYRQLSFCRTVDVDGETVVFNVLTGEIAALTAAEAAILRAPAVLPGVAASIQAVGGSPSFTSATNTSSELNGTILPASKAEINNPGSPHSMRSCIVESIKASIR